MARLHMLTLPAEIRMHIFFFIVQFASIRAYREEVYHKDMDVSYLSSEVLIDFDLDTAILSVCKQLYCEARNVFEMHLHLVIEAPLSGNTWKKMGMPPSLTENWLWKLRKLHIEYDHALYFHLQLMPRLALLTLTPSSRESALRPSTTHCYGKPEWLQYVHGKYDTWLVDAAMDTYQREHGSHLLIFPEYTDGTWLARALDWKHRTFQVRDTISVTSYDSAEEVEPAAVLTLVWDMDTMVVTDRRVQDFRDASESIWRGDTVRTYDYNSRDEKVFRSEEKWYKGDEMLHAEEQDTGKVLGEAEDTSDDNREGNSDSTDDNDGDNNQGGYWWER